MNTKDITKEQLDTLVLIHSLEEFITDEHENLSNLNDVICNFAENQTEDFNRLAKDICKLTVAGYIKSDMPEITDEELEIIEMPYVEGITPRGMTVLNELEQEVKSNISEGKKIVLFENFTLFNFDISLLGGVEMSLFKEAGGLFKTIGRKLIENMKNIHIFK